MFEIWIYLVHSLRTRMPRSSLGILILERFNNLEKKIQTQIADAIRHADVSRSV